MRWNWMGQLLGQSLQHGANWKGMSAVEGAGAADADAANAANAAGAGAGLVLLLLSCIQFCSSQALTAELRWGSAASLWDWRYMAAAWPAWPAWAAAQAREA